MITENIILKLLEREKKFFLNDFYNYKSIIKKNIKNSKIIIIGGAGSIGSSVVKLILKYDPKLLI